MKKKYVILAPHVDDEVIGCFRLLEAGEVHSVVYINELSDERTLEALLCADYFDFIPYFGLDKYQEAQGVETITLAPNIADNHRDHKAANLFAKRMSSQPKYYSIDMNTRVDTLPCSVSKRKREALNGFFPSQRPLFENEKYFLFESLVDTDILSKKILYFTNARVELSSYDPLQYVRPEFFEKDVADIIGKNAYDIDKKLNQILKLVGVNLAALKVNLFDPDTKIGDEREFQIG